MTRLSVRVYIGLVWYIVCFFQLKRFSEVLSTSDDMLFQNDRYVDEISNYVDLQNLKYHLKYPERKNISTTIKQYNLSKHDKIYLIMYYAYWCPHCHRRASLWRNIAALFHCTPGIRFFAFECATTDKSRIGSDGVPPCDACLRESISLFPSIVGYVQENGIKQSITNHSLLIPSPTIKVSDDDLLKYLFGLKDNYSNPNNSTIFNSVQLTSLFTEYSVKKYTQIPFNSFQSIKQWILMTARLIQPIKCTLSETDLDFGTHVHSDNSNNGISTQFISTTNLMSTGHIPLNKRWDTSIDRLHCPDIKLHDAITGLLFLLRHWVFIDNGVLTQHRYDKLIRLLIVSRALLPGDNIKNELLLFKDKIQHDSNQQHLMTKEAYHSALDNLTLGGIHAPFLNESILLLDSPRITSSIWILFHLWTISLFTQAEPYQTHFILSHSTPSCSNGISNPLISHIPSPSLTPLHLVTVIRDTVNTFFGCAVCRIHFIKAIDKGIGGLSDWVTNHTLTIDDTKDTDTEDRITSSFPINNSYYGIVLWLWRLHNMITFRIAIERTSDQFISIEQQTGRLPNVTIDSPLKFEGQDVRFPPSVYCPHCRHTGFLIDHMTSLPLYHTHVDNILVDKSIAWERYIQGMTTDTNDTLSPLTDEDVDFINDFNLASTFQFLLSYFWRSEWSPSINQLRLSWNINTYVFDVTSDRLFTDSIRYETRDGFLSHYTFHIKKAIFLQGFTILLIGILLSMVLLMIRLRCRKKYWNIKVTYRLTMKSVVTLLSNMFICPRTIDIMDHINKSDCDV